MADDALGLRGFAQVLQKPNLGNLYALAQIKERQRAQEAEMAERKRKEDQAYFEKSVALGDDPNLNLVLNENLAKNTRNTSSAMQKIFYDSARTGTPVNRSIVNQLKTNLDTNRNITSGFYNDYKGILQSLDSNKNMVNMPYASEKLKKIQDGFMQFDDKKNLVFDPSAAAQLKDFYSDGELWNLGALSKDYVAELGNMAVDVFDRSSNTSKQIQYDNAFLTDKIKRDGVEYTVPRKDVNTGKPIPNSSPEAIALWDAKGANYAAALDNHAKKLGVSRAEAFTDIIKSHAGYKEAISNNFPPGYGTGLTSPTVNFELSDSKGDSFKPYAEVKGGITGKAGKELDLQQGLSREQRKVRITDAQGNEQEVEVQRFGLSTEGEKGIIATPLYSDGTLKDKSIFVPIDGRNTNLMTILNAKLKPSERAKLNTRYGEFLKATPDTMVYDTEKLDKVTSGIEGALKGYFKSDEDAATQIKSVLVDNGFPSDVDVKVDKGGIWDTVNINGKSISVSKLGSMSDKSKEEFKQTVYDAAKAKFSKKEGEKKQIGEFDELK